MVLEPDTGQSVPRECWPQRGVDCEILHRLERETSASEDAGLGWVVGSYIDWRGERVPAKTLALKVGGL